MRMETKEKTIVECDVCGQGYTSDEVYFFVDGGQTVAYCDHDFNNYLEFLKAERGNVYDDFSTECG